MKVVTWTIKLPLRRGYASKTLLTSAVRSRQLPLPVAADAAHIQTLGSLGDFAE
jgi:hypothetical protein